MAPSNDSTSGAVHEQKVEEGKGFEFGAGDLAALTGPPKFKTVEAEREYLKIKLTAAMRIFDHLGYCHGVAGHITVRDPAQDHTYWVGPFGISWRLITVSDLLRVNEKGEVIEGGRPGRKIVNLAGFHIHSAIHRARPDVQAICHSHSPYGKAFSTLDRTLDIITQDSCVFYGDLAHLKDFGGVVITEGESNLIAETLGAKKAIILQNHGILTVGGSVDSAVAWLETQAKIQLIADAASVRDGVRPILIDEPQAAFTFKEIGHERAGFFSASPYFQEIDFLQGAEYKK